MKDLSDNIIKPAAHAIDANVLTGAIEKAVVVIKDYYQTLPKSSVKSELTPGSIAANFPQRMPVHGENIDELMLRVREDILPGLTHWQHPRFFAYYPGTTSIPAIVGDLLIAAFATVGLQWSANPAATELECVVMDWLLDLLHAPIDSPFRHTSRRGGGIIQNTAGEAIATVMMAACINAQQRYERKDSSHFVVYLSDQTHFSTIKAVRVAGMRVHVIKSRRLASQNFGIDAEQVMCAIENDRKEGLIPCALQLNLGSTNTCGSDDFASFENFGERSNLWINVDAAYAGAALVLPERKELSLLVQHVADSFNFNGSKWFLCGFDSAFLFVRDRKFLKAAFSADAEYLAPAHDENIYNPEFKDWSLPLGRKFRALRIWLVLSYFGREGLTSFLHHTIAQADYARDIVDKSIFLKQIVTTDLGLVCFRLNLDDEEKNRIFLQRVEECSQNGKNFLIYPSSLEGQGFLRLALGGIATTHDDIQCVLQVCIDVAKEIVNA